jgi:hypothetical protein
MSRFGLGPHGYPIRRLLFLRDAGAVKRNHTARVRGQNLAEHVHGVVELILAVRPEASSVLIKAGLRHDVYELVTGDSPATAKWMCQPLADALHAFELDLDTLYKLIPALEQEEDCRLLKWADMAEYVMFCLEEVYGGNRWAMPGLHKGWGALQNIPLAGEDYDNARPIIDYIRRECQQCLPE